MTMTEATKAKHAITRVRHEPRRRLLTVRKVERLTPNMARVTLAGDLTGFTSSAYDDHVKVFFPLPGQSAPTIPGQGPNGPVHAEGVERSPSRDYTPRRYDAARNELVIDFALHDAGPATDWATRAAPGQQLGVGGPRGSFVVPDDFDWYLFIGDETALPAIGRRLEELRAGTQAIVVAAVTGPEEEPGRCQNGLGAAAAVPGRRSRAAARCGSRADAAQDRRRLRLGGGRIADGKAVAPPSDRRARPRQSLGQGRRLLEARRRQHPRNPQRLTADARTLAAPAWRRAVLTDGLDDLAMLALRALVIDRDDGVR